MGTGHKDWMEFLQAIRDVDVDHIREGVNMWRKEQEAQAAIAKRIQQLEKLTVSPTAPLRQQLMAFNIGNQPLNITQAMRQTASVPANPFANTGSGHGNLFYPVQQRTPNQS